MGDWHPLCQYFPMLFSLSSPTETSPIIVYVGDVGLAWPEFLSWIQKPKAKFKPEMPRQKKIVALHCSHYVVLSCNRFWVETDVQVSIYYQIE